MHVCKNGNNQWGNQLAGVFFR